LTVSKMEKKIPVVSDESDLRTFLPNLLHAVPFPSIAARNPDNGLHFARSDQPGSNILDVMMADKAGMKCYRRLKTDRELKAIPVIMLSAIDKKVFYTYEWFRRTDSRTRIPEPEGFLEKPPEGEELPGLVNRLIMACNKEPGEPVHQ